MQVSGGSGRGIKSSAPRTDPHIRVLRSKLVFHSSTLRKSIPTRTARQKLVQLSLGHKLWVENGVGTSPRPSAVSFSRALRGVSSWPFQPLQPPHLAGQPWPTLGSRSGSSQRNCDGEDCFQTAKCHRTRRTTMNKGENTRPSVHVSCVRRQDVVQCRLPGCHLRTPVPQQSLFVRLVRGRRAARAD